MMDATHPLHAALRLAARGVPTFPVLASKAPACPGGFKAASSDPAAVEALWRAHAGPLIGVPTGERSGIDVLDIDAPRHAEACAWWEANRDALPATRTHGTRSGGLHLLFRAAPGLRCSAGKLAVGVDVRASGGYAVWWPSAGLPIVARGPVADWPAHILTELQPPPAPCCTPVAMYCKDADVARRYALAALRRAVAEVASAREGTRNAKLNLETFALCRFVASGALTATELAEAMAASAVAAGLNVREITLTVASALRAGGAA